MAGKQRRTVTPTLASSSICVMAFIPALRLVLPSEHSFSLEAQTIISRQFPFAAPSDGSDHADHALPHSPHAHWYTPPPHRRHSVLRVLTRAPRCVTVIAFLKFLIPEPEQATLESELSTVTFFCGFGLSCSSCAPRLPPVVFRANHALPSRAVHGGAIYPAI